MFVLDFHPTSLSMLRITFQHSPRNHAQQLRQTAAQDALLQCLQVRDREMRVTNSFFFTIVGICSNIASHSCGLMPREEIMYSRLSAWMFSSCAWRPSTSFSSGAVTNSRITCWMLSPTMPSAAEK